MHARTADLLRAVIVDDEQPGVEVLRHLLARTCPQVCVVGVARTFRQAQHLLTTLNYELAFVDVRLDEELGLALADTVKKKGALLIYVTAYPDYAVEAVRQQAFDYLLKPVDQQALRRCIERASKYLRGKHSAAVRVSSRGEVQWVPCSSILYLESASYCCILRLQDGKSVVVSRTLKEIEESLPADTFLRVHRRYVVNLNHVKALRREPDGKKRILLDDGTTHIPVSRHLYSRVRAAVERHLAG